MKTKIWLVAVLLFTYTYSFAQLKIGDKVPDATLEHIIHYKSATAKLSDFKGKMIIIDFWATWCVPCIRSMPTLDSIQTGFPEQLTILSVTDEQTDKVVTFMKNIPSLRNLRLPVITKDTVLGKIFPHNSVPHDVVIDKNGIVIAITSIENITSTSVAAMLKGDKPPMRVKKAAPNIDLIRPFLQDIGETVRYQFSIAKYYEGLLGGQHKRGGSEFGKDTLISGTNDGLLNMYRTTMLRRLGNSDNLPENRIQLLVNDTTKFLEPKNVTVTEYDKWIANNAYCYTMIILRNSKLDVYTELKNNLDRVFGYSCRMEKQKLNCLIITTIDSNKYKTKGGKFLFDNEKKWWSFTNYPFEGVVQNINRKSKSPIIDETGFAGNVDMTLIPAFSDLSSFKRQLNQYGFDVMQEERTVDVMVIEDQK